MIYYLKRIIKNISNNNKNLVNNESNKPNILSNKLNTSSYGDFLKNNPNATRAERRDAIQKFLNSTRK